MQENLNKALLYETLYSLSSGNEKKAYGLYCDVAAVCSVSQPLFNIMKEVMGVTGLSDTAISSAYNTVRHSFDSYPFNYEILSREDPLFPSSLKDIHFLYLFGNTSLLEGERVTLLGMRGPSEDARLDAVHAVGELKSAGVTLMTTLDTGLDAYISRYAFNQKLRQIVVLASPLHQCVPQTQQDLMVGIANSGPLGLLVSPFAPCRRAQKWFTVPRNDVLAALSRTIVIIEEKDGGPLWKLCAKAGDAGCRIMIANTCASNPIYSYAAAFVRRGTSLYRKNDLKKMFSSPQERKRDKKKDDGQLELF